ncbi:hypothetical protein FQR65_LT06831 [Abscondita terminalis]|nr:hypothetical protein FQR65_LT06831 [Abscondita terminalis]
MIYDYDELQPEDQELPQSAVAIVSVPDAESEFITAKMFLQTCSTETGDNLYDHLTDVLNKILAERPQNVIDFFEEYSRKVKEKRFKPLNDHLEDIYVSPKRYMLSKKIMPLLRAPTVKILSTADPEDEQICDMSRNNMLQLCYFFEQSGFGLPRHEMFILMLSMRKLIKKEPIAEIRFWGKIFGLYRNYYILETELTEEENAKINDALEVTLDEIKEDPDNLSKELESISKVQETEGEGPVSKVPRTLPPAPEIHYQEPPEPPPEPLGTGANKKVYYVCNELEGDDWVRLPNVTPLQIRVSRKIKKSFTGMLTQEIITYPHFPGTESNYLRAQLARISAGTQISPLGFYTFRDDDMGEEDEECEEDMGMGEVRTNYKENKNYEPPALRDLLDNSMSFWVHHNLFILPQGRTTWWNPNPTVADDDVGEEDFGEEEVPKHELGPEPETGPPLLTPLSEDATLEAILPWSVRVSSTIVSDYALAVVRSNLWPGAYCFSTQGKIFQNVYIGSGHKYMSHNFTPDPLPYVEQDYPLGPEIMEMTDPTGAQEEQWRLDHLPPPPCEPQVGDEADEEEAEEEEEEEDDD